MTHVRSGVADIGVLDFADRLVAMLAHSHNVGDHLRGMILVGEAIVDRHTRIFRESLYTGL